MSAQTLTVADGTEANSFVPVYGYYADAYLRSQTIYPASMLSNMNGMPINSMVFYFQDVPASAWGATFQVKLSEVTDDEFYFPEFLENTDAEIVYTGFLDATGNVLEVPFDLPYDYMGGNLLVEVVTVDVGVYSACSFLGVVSDDASMQGYSYSDVSDIGPYTRDFIPKTTFSYGSQASCSRPSAIAVQAVTTTDVTISWSNVGTTTSYTYQYMPVTSTDWDVDAVEVTTSDAYATITGLAPGAGYKFRVNATCSDNVVTDWSYEFNFNMMNIPVTLPYEQNFETNPESISDFALSSNGVNQWFIGSATGVPSDDPSGQVHSLYISNDMGATNNYSNGSPSESYAEIDMTFDESDVEWTFSFDYKVGGESGWDYLSVYLVDGTTAVPTEGAPTGDCLLYRASNTTSWQHFSTILENVSGTSKKIVFYWNNDNTGGNNPAAAVDNISIEGNSCAQPSQFVATNVGTNQVTLDWDEMGNATGWTISYGPVGYDFGDEEETIVVVATHPFTIGNLTPATEYDFYVQANCESNWTGPLSLIPSSYLMNTTGSDTLTTCGLLIFDDGGPDDNYGSEAESYLVLYPANEGEMMLLTGVVSTESCCDYLRIYDGAGLTGPMVEFRGENQVVNVLSTTGPLTIYFHSDYSLTFAGFQLFAECVSCFPPSNVVASDATLNGATISWSGDAESYAIYVEGPTSGYYTTTDTFYVLTDLNSSSFYTVQVRSICGTDSSILSSAVTFATECDAVTLTLDTPWEEDFEQYQGEGVQPLICWETPVTTTFGNVSYPSAYCQYAPACHSGVNSMEMRANYGESNMAVLPEFTNNIHDLRLSFWATTTYASYGILEVGVLTDEADTSTFELVGVCGAAGIRGPYSASAGAFGNYMGAFSFNNVAASSGRIALRFTSDYSSTSYLSWNLDDFKVELNPNCSSPVKTSVTATDVDGHSATISWVDEDEDHTAWTVYYKKASDSEWSTYDAINTSVVLSGLDPLTTYQVYVITNCGVVVDDPDATLTISFTTLVACPAPTLVTLASVSENEAVITWHGTADSYNVEYGVAGFTPGTGITAVATTNSYTVTSLNPNTSYTIYINSDCTSAYDSLSTTVSYTFKTTELPQVLPYSTDFSDTTETWTYNTGTCVNHWTMGTYNEAGAMFVTYDGTTPGYSHQAASVSVEKLFTVGESETFNISFDVQAGGESTFDFLKVFFAPAQVNYMPSASQPPFGQANYSTYAVNFVDYLAQTGNTTSQYKFNLTNGNTVHVEVEMSNPNANATPTSTAKLVFFWRNDGSSGYQPGAIITNLSISPSSCPLPSALTADNIAPTSASISWTPGNVESEWEVEYGISGYNHGEGTLETVLTTPSVTLSNLTAGSSYDIYVRAICGSSDSSSWVGPLTILPGSYLMPATGTQSITACDLIVFDDGGLLGNYGNYCESYLTIYPEDSTSILSIQGTLSTEACCDYLRIYDGINTQAPLLGEFKGQNVTIPLLLSSGGPLTLYFHSDVSLNYSGFQLAVACVSNTCEAPTDLTISNINTTTADISWTASGSVTNWNLEYKEVSAGTWTSVAVSGIPSYHLTGLAVGTAYNVRVQTDCGTDNQSFWVIGMFNTSCETIVSFPYTEGFENEGNIPACWEQVFVTGTLNWVFQNGGGSIAEAHSGAYNAFLYYASTENKETRLISPVFDLTNVVEPYVSFWHTQPIWVTDQDILTVYYRTSATAEWQQLVQYTNSLAVWTFDSIALPSPSATYQIAFEGKTAYGHGIDLDDITVYDGNSSPVVADPTVATVTATEVLQTTATLNATITNPDNVTITAKGFEWKATSGGNYTQIAGTGTANSFTAHLTGLTPNTSYTFKAFITFNGTTVYGDEMTFMTQEVAPLTEPSATTADASDVTYNSAVLNGSISNPDNVTITAQGFEWKAMTEDTYVTVNAQGATMTYNLTDLAANTEYTYRAFVTTANGTHYGQNVTFTTQETPAEPCDAPTGLTVTDIQSESISVTWDNAPALRWNVQYTPLGGTASTVTATTNSYTISNLTPETTYQIRVQAVCEEDYMSAWSAPIAVATLVGLNIYLENNVTLYPSPAKEYVDVRVDGDVNVTGMDMFDVYGKLIRTVVGANNDSPIRINVSDLSAGMYFVRVTTEQGVVTKRFVKK